VIVPAVTLAAIIGLLLAETRVSRLHQSRLQARGAILPPGDPYLALKVLYPAAFVIMGIEGLWRASAAEAAGVAPGPGAPSWFASGLVLFVASKALKYWAIRSLGELWTFRVYVVPGVPLVRTGPYRHVAHPNYIAVVGELVGTAMMMGARLSGPVTIALFGLALAARVRFENRVLSKIGR
jgi:methyltransferase